MLDNKNKIICSIIIPLYNGKKFILETIDSCLNQLFQNIEIIVIDDFSTDGSYGYVQKSYKNNNNVRIFRNKKNLGLCKTINYGALVSGGKFILILGHDDLILKHHIEILLKELDNNTSFIHCNAEHIDKDGKSLGMALNDQEQLKKNNKFMVYSSFANFVHSTGTIIRKASFDKVGGADEKYKNYHEYPLWIKLSMIGNVKYTTKIYAKYRIHDTNITNTFQNPEIKIERDRFKQECRKLAISYISNWKDRTLRIIIYLKRSVEYRVKKHFL